MLHFECNIPRRVVKITPRRGALLSEAAAHLFGVDGVEEPLLEGEELLAGQWRIMHTQVQRAHLFEANGQTLTEFDHVKALENPYYVKTASMVSPNIVDTSVSHPFCSSLGLTVLSAREEFQERWMEEWECKNDEIYDVATYGQCKCARKFPAREHNKDTCEPFHPARFAANSPSHLAINAFLSGSDMKGVYESLLNITSNVMKIGAPPRYVASALIQSFAMSGVKDLFPVAPTKHILPYIPYDGNKSSGYLNVTQGTLEIDGEIFRMKNCADQGMAYPLVVAQVEEIAKKVAEGVKTQKYSRDWFPELVAKISAKAEPKEVGTPASKVRIFFIMSMLRLMVDKIIFGKVFPTFYSRKHVGIGHVWGGGGAQKVAEYMRHDDPDFGWISTDVTKLDQSLVPSLLTLLFTFPLAFYGKDQDRETYEILRAWMTWSADGIATTLTKWTGMSYRWVIGVMFSGLYGTSWGDTIYVDVCIRIWFFAMHAFIRQHHPEMEELWNKTPRRVQIYGDNILIGMHHKILEMFIMSSPLYTKTTDSGVQQYKFGHFQHYFATMLGLRLKEEETHYYPPGHFFTEVEIIQPAFPVECPEGKRYNVEHRIVRKGVEYLKRYFVKIPSTDGSVIIAPFRHVRDYYTKSITTASQGTADVSISRWVGLMIDSAGTNVQAWNFLAYLLRKFYRGVVKLHDLDLNDALKRAVMCKDADCLRRNQKMGIPLDLIEKLDRRTLLSKFVRANQVNKVDWGKMNTCF